MGQDFSVRLKINGSDVKRIAIGNSQHRGARPYQEDSFGYTPLDRAEKDGFAAVVADGMGGLSAGDKVSAYAVSAMLEMRYQVQSMSPVPVRFRQMLSAINDKGGFGITYLAYDITTGKKAAIKEFYPYGLALRTAGNPTVAVTTSENASVFKSGAERFYEEAKLVSRFNGNPNIVAVHEFFYENDTVYFSMEYLSGHTLKQHIQEHGTLNPGQALFIAQNVSNALMAAHSASVLHRDISPDNIMLCSNGEVKLIDFGAARQVVAEHSQSFSVILKPGFAPLEQYKKKGNQGPWTDIYSLGSTLYYALTEDIPEDPMTRLDDEDCFAENKFNILDFMGLTIDGTLDVSGNDLTEEQADEICSLLDGDLKSIVF